MATKSEKARRKRRYSNAKETMTAAEEGYRPTAFKVPEGVSVFKFSEEKVYRIDVLPFTAGKGNPRADEGTDHFERTIYVHRNLGPSRKESHCCLAKNFNKACPCCDHRQRISNDPDGDQELADNLKPQWRHLWLVYDYDDPDKGVQLMDTAHYKSFGELLSNKVRAGDEDDNFENFHHLEDGMTLKVACEEDSFNGNTFYRPTNIEMKPRKTPLDASLTDEVPCLDDLPIELSYKKLKEIMLAEPAEDQEDEDEDSETSEDEDEEEKKPTKKPGKKTGKKPTKPEDEDEDAEEDDEDADEEDEEDDTEGEEEDSEDEDEEEKPKFKKGDNVKGEYRDKAFTGKVIAIKNGLVHVETLKGNLRVMNPGDLKLVSRPEEEDEEGEEEKPKPKKTGKTSKPTSKKPSKKEEEEDDEDIWDEDDDEEEESEDEDEE